MWLRDAVRLVAVGVLDVVDALSSEEGHFVKFNFTATGVQAWSL